jgi:hypothetical protein
MATETINVESPLKKGDTENAVNDDYITDDRELFEEFPDRSLSSSSSYESPVSNDDVSTNSSYKVSSSSI